MIDFDVMYRLLPKPRDTLLSVYHLIPRYLAATMRKKLVKWSIYLFALLVTTIIGDYLAKSYLLTYPHCIAILRRRSNLFRKCWLNGRSVIGGGGGALEAN